MLSGKNPTYGNLRFLTFTDIHRIMMTMLEKLRRISEKQWQFIIRQVQHIDEDIKIPSFLNRYVVNEHRLKKYVDFWRIALPLIDHRLFEFRPYYGRNETDVDRYRAERLNNILEADAGISSFIGYDRKMDPVSRITTEGLLHSAGATSYIHGDAESKLASTSDIKISINHLTEELKDIRQTVFRLQGRAKSTSQTLARLKAKYMYVSGKHTSGTLSEDLSSLIIDTSSKLGRIQAEVRQLLEMKTDREHAIQDLRIQLMHAIRKEKHKKKVTVKQPIKRKRKRHSVKSISTTPPSRTLQRGPTQSSRTSSSADRRRSGSDKITLD